MLTTRYTTISNTVYTVEEGFGCTFVTRQGARITGRGYGTDLDWPDGQRVPVAEVQVRANGGLHIVAREWDVPSLFTSRVREMLTV